jgi:hypothetical protein
VRNLLLRTSSSTVAACAPQRMHDIDNNAAPFDVNGDATSLPAKPRSSGSLSKKKRMERPRTARAVRCAEMGLETLSR